MVKAMQNDYAVRVEHATVRFNLAKEKVDNLKEYCIRLAKRQLMYQEFLAVQDVSLTVKPGEAWGLIGANGSGKSTLLKLICGILKPYRGSVSVRGSIAPLIELGAGFDGDLTGRENVFLNGALLGYPQKYMEEHFDEIANFAELGQFLDSPIKNYSSGMKARLAFRWRRWCARRFWLWMRFWRWGTRRSKRNASPEWKRCLPAGQPCFTSLIPTPRCARSAPTRSG